MTEAVILAGGLGTRLRSAVPDLPKPMAPVDGKPFLAYLLDNLGAQDFDHAVLSVGYRHEVIREAFGDRHGSLRLSYAVESTPIGTGGAMRFAMRECSESRVFVLNGDSFVQIDFAAMRAATLASGAQVALCVTPVPDAWRYGRVRVVADRVTGFTEKGESGPGLINAGIYLIEKRIILEAPLPEAFSFERDFLQPQVETLAPFAFVGDGRFIDIGIPEDYARAAAFFASLPIP